MAVSIECIEQTNSTLTVRLIGLNGAYAYDDRYIEWQYKRSATSNNWYICEDTTPIGAYVEESDAYTITDLFPGTTYYIQAIIYFDNGTTVPVDVVNFSTDAYYSVYCYMSSQHGASPNISECTVSVPSWGVEETKSYNEDGDDLTILNIPIGYNVEFNATPADGCVFTKWVYRVGSATASKRESTSNPLEIRNPQGDIYIRAEAETVIKSFTVVAPGVDDKTFKWKCTLSKEYDEPIEYRMMVRRSGESSYEGDTGAIPIGGMTDYESLTVNRFGGYYFQLFLTIDGEEFVSDSILKVANASPIETSNFNMTNVEGSLNITASWDTNMIYDDATTYSVNLYKMNEDGKWKNVWTSEEYICLLKNSISFRATDYGEYFIYIVYRVDGYNFGKEHRSESFVLVEGEWDIPPLWEWTSPMYGQLTVDKNKEVHPVTAIEWNEFTNRLMELKNCFVSEGFVLSDFPTNFLIAEPNVEIKDLYNEVSSALSYLCSETHGNITDIYILSNRTELSARLFTSLQDNLNYLIGYL